MKRSRPIIKKLKNAQEDFEWYPTTKAILAVIHKDLEKFYIREFSLLDPCAGDGRALTSLCPKGIKYGVEKSSILRECWHKDIIPIGTDFFGTNLINIGASVTFCNPPYSEYSEWASKIIRETESELLYFVIPARWRNNKNIKLALADRKLTYKVIGKADFNTNVDSGERKARAVVEIIRFDNRGSHIRRPVDYGQYTYNADPSTAFKLWYSKTFSRSFKESKEEPPFTESVQKHAIVCGSYIQALVELYNREMQQLHESFTAINNLPDNIYQILGLSKSNLSKVLLGELNRLKKKYWSEFFKQYKPIKQRLTKKNRVDLLKTLPISIDFTEENALAVTVWVLKKVQSMLDSQVIDLMEGLLTATSIKPYKSNQKTFDLDEWRFNSTSWQEKHSHYGISMDYRIVVCRPENTLQKSHDPFRTTYINKMAEHTHDFLNDIMTTARNMGVSVNLEEDSKTRNWEQRKPEVFMLSNGNPFMEVRAHFNGNLHIKFDQGFLKIFNVEFGRLKGWLRHKEDAASELGLDAHEVAQFWKSNGNFRLGTYLKLLMV